MATITQTILDASGFVPQAWAAKALDVLRANITLAKYIARDTDMTEAGWQGKQLTVGYPGTLAAQDKVAGVAVTAQAPTGNGVVTITLAKHKVIDILVEDYGAAQANGDALGRYVQPAVVGLAEQFENDLFTLYTSLTGGTIGTSGTDLTPALARTARKTLNDNRAPMGDRHLVISDKDEIAFLSDTNLQQYYAFSNPGAIEQGNLPPLYGFATHVSQLVPAVAGTPVSTKNLFFHKNAMMFAMRPFKDIPAGSGVSAATIVDEETGLAIRVVKQYKAEYRAEYVGFDILYGFVALRPNQGLVALS